MRNRESRAFIVENSMSRQAIEDKAKSLAKEKALEVGRTVAHDNERYTLELRAIEGDVGVVWAPQIGTKRLPLGELYDFNYFLECIDRVKLEDIRLQSARLLGVSASEVKIHHDSPLPNPNDKGDWN